MRKLGIGISVLALLVVSACSTADKGDAASAHAKSMGFEVTGVGDNNAVVKIGNTCTGKFEAWPASSDEINYVYNRDGKAIFSQGGNKATGPDQFKGNAATASCYI